MNEMKGHQIEEKNRRTGKDREVLQVMLLEYYDIVSGKLDIFTVPDFLYSKAVILSMILKTHIIADVKNGRLIVRNYCGFGYHSHWGSLPPAPHGPPARSCN